MRKLFSVLLTGCMFFSSLYAQNDTVTSVSDQIRFERDVKLQEMSQKLQTTESEIKRLEAELSRLADSKTSAKMQVVEELQDQLKRRIEILEAKPKERTKFNGQIAFTELLSIQRDINPAELFIATNVFLNDLGSVSNIQNYSEFTDWLSEYNKWADKQTSNNQMLALVDNALKLVTDVTNKVPLYGSIVQTVYTGVSTVVMDLGKKNKNLISKTPAMLTLLTAASQFETQKAIVDHEWRQINEELNLLKTENQRILKGQLTFYGLDSNKMKDEYLGSTTETNRDLYKTFAKQAVASKLDRINTDSLNKNKWEGQVESLMYQVQSLRMRFGQLTLRMFNNMKNYSSLIQFYSDAKKFPSISAKVSSLGSKLESVKSAFNRNFNPHTYIEQSATMYVEQPLL